MKVDNGHYIRFDANGDAYLIPEGRTRDWARYVAGTPGIDVSWAVPLPGLCTTFKVYEFTT